MAVVAAPRRTAGRSTMVGIGQWLLPRLGLLAFLAVVSYLVIAPLISLQNRAFEDGARGYRTAYGSGRMADTIITTVALALGSRGPRPGCLPG